MRKVIACIPCKGRLPLLRITISRLLNVNGCYKVICAGDTPQEERVIRDNGGDFIYHTNSPLGSKWNATFVRASEYNPDACLFVGSSDWISENWVDNLYPYLSELGYDMVGKVDFNMVHVRGTYGNGGDLQMANWGGYTTNRKGEAIGIGRMIGRVILEKLAYRPFEPTLDNSMDYSMHQRVLSVGGKIKSLDSKTEQSLSISCDEWKNKHNFFRESTYVSSTPISNPKEWLTQWGFTEIFDFAKDKRI